MRKIASSATTRVRREVRDGAAHAGSPECARDRLGRDELHPRGPPPLLALEPARLVERRDRVANDMQSGAAPQQGPHRMVALFLFDGELIVCERVYFDASTILRQLGIGP